MNEKDGMVEGYFFFDPDDPIFVDHFPGHPVVPGSMIIHAFLTAAVRLKWLSMPVIIQAFRFKRFISPGRYRYRLKKKGIGGCLTCQLYEGQNVVTTGEFN